MFGMFRKPAKGLFGGGIVATPEQEAESARIAKQLGIGGVDEAEPSPVQGAFGIGGKIMPGAQGAKRGGVFGSGVPWGDALFALGGAIAGDGGAAVQQVQQRRQAPLIEQAKRESEWADWQRKERWKLDNRPPPNNDTVADYEFIRSTLGEEAARKYLMNRADPPRYIEVDDGRGGKRIVPASSIGGAPNLPDTLPPDFFDGGPASAPGGFPGGY